ncbi:MAG: hypothetical protein JXN65_03580 [Clostridia bacterium]|nr:hypothetical protein [Clostridia bacterium]
MRTDSITEKIRKKIETGKIFLLVGAMLFATLFIIYLININKEQGIVFMMLAIIVFWFFMLGSLSFLGYFGLTKLISRNQMHEFDENSIKVYDDIDGVIIENEFKWSKIIHIEIESQASIIDKLRGIEVPMLVIIADKEQFYKGINKKDRFTHKIEKHKTKLSGGFFILCSDVELHLIKDYWGKEIKEDIY